MRRRDRRRALSEIHHVHSIPPDITVPVLIRFRRVCMFETSQATEVFHDTCPRSVRIRRRNSARLRASPAPASARTSFDGNWSVLIVTRAARATRPIVMAFRSATVRSSMKAVPPSMWRAASAARHGRRPRLGRLAGRERPGRLRGDYAAGTVARHRLDGPCVGDLDGRAALRSCRSCKGKARETTLAGFRCGSLSRVRPPCG